MDRLNEIQRYLSMCLCDYDNDYDNERDSTKWIWNRKWSWAPTEAKYKETLTLTLTLTHTYNGSTIEQAGCNLMYYYIFDQIDIESSSSTTLFPRLWAKNYSKATERRTRKKEWQKRIIFEQNCDGLTRNFSHNKKIHFPFFDWFLHRFHSTFCTIFWYGTFFLTPLFRSP